VMMLAAAVANGRPRAADRSARRIAILGTLVAAWPVVKV